MDWQEESVSWSAFQKTDGCKSLLAVCVSTGVQQVCTVCSFPWEPEQLTLFILVGASRAVAVARLQSVVSPGPGDTKCMMLSVKFVDLQSYFMTEKIFSFFAKASSTENIQMY